jgi:hypothetical protein
VHFACDDAPLFACRLCILRFGLHAGDRQRLFADERAALSHTTRHAADIRTASAGTAIGLPGGEYAA